MNHSYARAKQLVDFKKPNSSQFDKESNRLRER